MVHGQPGLAIAARAARAVRAVRAARAPALAAALSAGVLSAGAVAGCGSGHGQRAGIGLSGAPGASVLVACRSDAAGVATAAEAYHSEVGMWPPDIAALTAPTTVGGRSVGPWLRAAPGSQHYSIFVDPGSGGVYVYPPGTPVPTSFDPRRSAAAGDPCASIRY